MTAQEYLKAQTTYKGSLIVAGRAWVTSLMEEYASLKTKELEAEIERLMEILNEHKGLQQEQDENEMDMYYHELED